MVNNKIIFLLVLLFVVLIISGGLIVENFATSSGTLLQLVAKGPQDEFLTGHGPLPEINIEQGPIKDFGKSLRGTELPLRMGNPRPVGFESFSGASTEGFQALNSAFPIPVSDAGCIKDRDIRCTPSPQKQNFAFNNVSKERCFQFKCLR